MQILFKKLITFQYAIWKEVLEHFFKTNENIQSPDLDFTRSTFFCHLYIEKSQIKIISIWYDINEEQQENQ